MNMEIFDWPRLSGLVSESFSMNAERAAGFKASKAAQIVCALPYAAGCPEAERIALSHAAAFVMASYGPSNAAFDHKPEDDASYLARLEPVADHPGGDPDIVEAGLARLALMMLAGYERDLEADRASGAYNPLVSGAWELADAREELLEAARGDEGLDVIMTADEAATQWWDS